jgi:hypothetical protein
MSATPLPADQLLSPYEMTVDLNVLDHLGINLYSNIAAVLTEAVANAWDADADKVQIRVDPESKWIEIEDDGIGMTVSQGSRIVYYDFLIRAAQDSYAEYLRQSKKLDKLEGIVNRL